jgi:YD repeat-containing protein
VLPQTQLAVTQPDPGGQSDNSPMTTMYRWQLTTLDGVGRVAKVQSGTGNTPGTVVSETDTVYGPCACSPMGKMKQVSQPYAPGSTVYWTTYTYDAIGRTVSVVAAENSTTSYVYQGNVATVTDPAGKWKTTTTDVQGNTKQVYEPDPSGQASGLYTYYTYDTMEHLTQVSMPRGSVTQTRTFTYSPSTHLLTSETHPETGTTSYTYTADNFTSDLLTSKTDAKGQVTVYSYDTYYRVTEIQRYPSGVGGGEDVCQRVAYTYDSYYDGSEGFGASGQVAMIATGECVGVCGAGVCGAAIRADVRL